MYALQHKGQPYFVRVDLGFSKRFLASSLFGNKVLR